jgi:hypothetical protein
VGVIFLHENICIGTRIAPSSDIYAFIFLTQNFNAKIFIQAKILEILIYVGLLK